MQIAKRGSRAARVEPEFTQVGENRIIGATVFTDAAGGRSERYQVVTFRDGKIVDLQGCASLRDAERFARR